MCIRDSSQASLKKAAQDEEEARKAIQSGDKHGRDLNRLLGKATEDEQTASTAYSQAQLDFDRANQRSQIASENLADIEQSFETAELERDDQSLMGEDLEDSSPDTNRDSLAKELMSLQKQERSLVDDRDRAESKLRNAEMGLAKAKARMEAIPSGIMTGPPFLIRPHMVFSSFVAMPPSAAMAIEAKANVTQAMKPSVLIGLSLIHI